MLETTKNIEFEDLMPEKPIILKFKSFHDLEIGLTICSDGNKVKFYEENQETDYDLNIINVKFGKHYTKFTFIDSDEATTFYSELVEWEGIPTKSEYYEDQLKIGFLDVVLSEEEGVVVIANWLLNALAVELLPNPFLNKEED